MAFIGSPQLLQTLVNKAADKDNNNQAVLLLMFSGENVYLVQKSCCKVQWPLILLCHLTAASMVCVDFCSEKPVQWSKLCLGLNESGCHCNPTAC